MILAGVAARNTYALGGVVAGEFLRGACQVAGYTPVRSPGKFQRFWTYQSVPWARRFLREWCTWTMRSRLEPTKKVARSLREHEDLLMNWFKARGEISAGAVQGLNLKAKLSMRKAFGFRTFEGIETALYHQLGHLPEPEFTHEFC